VADCIYSPALSRSATAGAGTTIERRGLIVLRRIGVALAVTATAAALTSAPALAQRPHRLEADAGPAMGHVPARAAHSSGGNKTTSRVNMTWHNGQIMQSSVTEAVFWGTSWSNSSFVGDKISGLDSWYSGYDSSHYAGTTTEYNGTNGYVTASSTYNGHHIDTNAAPSGAPTTTQVINEVASQITNPVPNGYYPVYVDTPRGNTGYCAWHSYGTINGVPVQFAFFFNLDGDPGCDPQDSRATHSQGLEALANGSGHELAEAVTDPRNGGWYDRQGAENGDKCAWTFGAPYVTFSNGSTWKIQGEWSNNAYTRGTGYPNSSGQKGCLSGA
jgi:hypothetical protein